MSKKETGTFHAVVFDLFGTLVPAFSKSDHEAFLSDIASDLGCHQTQVSSAWLAAGTDRMTGRLGAVEPMVRALVGITGLSPSEETIRKILDRTLEFHRRALVPKPAAVEVLRWLRGQGLRIGVLSDCSPEVPHVWSSLSMAQWVDATGFSCEEGTLKPDPEFFGKILKRLGVRPDRALYVGDGSGTELSGAKKFGMDVLPVRIDLSDVYDPVRPDVENWIGEIASDLAEIPRLLRQMGRRHEHERRSLIDSRANEGRFPAT